MRRHVSRGRHRRGLVPGKPAGQRWGRAALVALLATVLLVVGLPGWWSAQETSRNAQPAAVAAEPRPATSIEDSPLPRSPSATPSESAPQHQLPDEVGAGEAGSPPLHISYHAVGLDQGVLPLTPTPQELALNSIVPPHTPDAYWLSPYGMPGEGSTNTTYVVGHSLEGGSSPFNNISAHAKAGDLLTITTAVGQLEFRVDGVTTEYKDTLRDSKIWDIVPGRLILITCYAADLWGKNIIVQASPLPSR
ncbi:class F sortase [Paenarthrobacter nitroguajacolicus]|uniref:class F sortase n=1 Tax=Paenarthrobacter nitroguajacolicus TaxID=211146 RepID=UPI00405489A2